MSPASKEDDPSKAARRRKRTTTLQMEEFKVVTGVADGQSSKNPTPAKGYTDMQSASRTAPSQEGKGAGQTANLSYSLVTDLFNAVSTAYNQCKKSQKGHLIPPQYENTSKLDTIALGGRRNVFILFDYHGDAYALTLLAQAIREMEGALPTQTLFIIEGSERKSVVHLNYSPQYLAEQIAHRFKIPVADGIRSVADWSVIDEVIRACSELDPVIYRKAIIGYLLLSEALQNPRRSKTNIPEGIETLIGYWNTTEQRVVGITELYAAVDKRSEMPKDRVQEINGLLQHVAQSHGGRLDLENWNVVSELIDQGKIHGITREESLGTVVGVMAPLSDQGYPDYLGTIRRLQKTWGEEVGKEELHKCFVQALGELRKTPDSFKERGEQITQMLDRAEDEQTAKNIYDILRQHSRVKNILIIAGLKHEKGVRAGLKS
jgi:hypothetical protein